MTEGAKGKNKEPSFLTAPIEVEPSKGNNNEEKKCVAKYPAVTEGLPEEEMPDGFINDVGEKWAYEQKPYIYAVC